MTRPQANFTRVHKCVAKYEISLNIVNAFIAVAVTSQSATQTCVIELGACLIRLLQHFKTVVDLIEITGPMKQLLSVSFEAINMSVYR